MRNRRRKRTVWTRYLLWLGCSAAILSLLFPLFNTITSPPARLSPTPTSAPTPEARKAAIVDQIALAYPNPEFVARALTYLKDAGFDVDVYEGKDVTVEFYRTLPTRDYKLIVIRTHSTNFLDEKPGGPVFLFTSEPYEKSRYVREQLTNQIGSARVLYDDNAPLYFAIISGFVRQSMVGRFDDTLIIIGGCQSLGSLGLASALVERGASAVVGWDEWVDLPHNDNAILHLLHALTVEKLTVKQAIEKTMSEIGPDPIYKSILTYFPKKEGDYTI